MKFIEFKEKLKDFMVFTINDIRLVESNFDLRRLSEWQDKGYIQMIRRRYYMFSDLKIDDTVLYLIANKIYSPSYISLEMALSYYGLIPEGVYTITSVTSQKTNMFKTTLGKFSYRHIKPELMFGYKLISYKDQSFKIAEIEKAVLDYFYLNTHFAAEEDFFEFRFNGEEFNLKANRNRLEKYLKSFHNKSLERRFTTFLKYIKYVKN